MGRRYGALRSLRVLSVHAFEITPFPSASPARAEINRSKITHQNHNMFPRVCLCVTCLCVRTQIGTQTGERKCVKERLLEIFGGVL